MKRMMKPWLGLFTLITLPVWVLPYLAVRKEGGGLSDFLDGVLAFVAIICVLMLLPLWIVPFMFYKTYIIVNDH